MKKSSTLFLSLFVFLNAQAQIIPGSPFESPVIAEVAKGNFDRLLSTFEKPPAGLGRSAKPHWFEVEELLKAKFNNNLYSLIDQLVVKFVAAEEYNAEFMAFKLSDLFLIEWPDNEKSREALTQLFTKIIDKLPNEQNIGILGSAQEALMAKISVGLSKTMPALADDLVGRLIKKNLGVLGLLTGSGRDAQDTYLYALKAVKKHGSKSQVKEMLKDVTELIKNDRFITVSAELKEAMSSSDPSEQLMTLANTDLKNLRSVPNFTEVLSQLDLDQRTKLLNLAFFEMLKPDSFDYLVATFAELSSEQLERIAHDFLYSSQKPKLESGELDVLYALKVSVTIADPSRREKFLRSKLKIIESGAKSCSVRFK